MAGMCYGASSFNKPIGSWNVAKVTNMRFMFCDASAVNQNLCEWRTKLNFATLEVFFIFDYSGCTNPQPPTSASSANWC
jgi:surface protein